jgi:hypothetical protein
VKNTTAVDRYGFSYFWLGFATAMLAGSAWAFLIGA